MDALGSVLSHFKNHNRRSAIANLYFCWNSFSMGDIGMSEFRGTKGEWGIGIVPDYNDTLKSAMLEVQSDSYWICKVQNNGMIGDNEGKANAQLISCAPEMLEMLQEIIASELLDGTIQGSKIKRLIKKATTICND